MTTRRRSVLGARPAAPAEGGRPTSEQPPGHDSEVWQSAAGWIHGCRTCLDHSVHATEAEAAERQRDHLQQPVPWWVHRIGAAPATADHNGATLPTGDGRDGRPVYAAKGHATVYRVPAFRPPAGCGCTLCVEREPTTAPA